uniref:Pleckstrin homology domain containing, family H (with MyTH4 domain) member 1 n=1 Tax=Fundulus heteroclitus TaxID=8078 RepID=A0A3Q2Q4X7_FUNHE
MADVLESSGAGGVGAASVDWQKRCVALEMQLLRFRLQAGKIRELLAEKMQELEQRVSEADQRAEKAEKQIQVMEEKMKSANVQTGEPENLLYKKYQDLTSQLQEKDAVIKRLEIQLEQQMLVRAQEAKIIEEKAAKIKDWVTFKLREMELENQQLKLANVKQTEQILLLQDKLQALLEKPASSGSPATSPVLDAHLVPSSPLFPPSCPGTPPAQDDSWRQTALRGAASNVKSVPTDRDNSSDELSSKFRSQCLHSSSSSSSSSSAYEMAHAPSSPGLTAAPTSPHLSRSPSTNNPFPISPQPPGHQSGTSMTLPKVRTPLTPRDSIQLVKKHYSQPQPTLDRLHQLNINIDITTPSSASSTLKSTATAASPFSQLVEETDIDDGLLDSMEGVVEGREAEELSQDGVSFVGLAEELEQLDPEMVKPPTPPLHRFPSWQESRIYAVAKSGMRVSEAGAIARGPGRGSTLPQYPAAGPFTQLIYKNISVPVYTTLKGKATQISSVPLPDDDSGSEDDSSSLASLRTSILSPERKGSVPGSPRAVKRVSMSSISSESDYAIPPDAYSLDSDYSEPEHKVQRTSSYSCESTGPTLEKSGYLLKMGSQVKAWKRRWFVLRNGEILYYKSPSCQLFINVLVESPSVDYHTSLAQNALQVCLTHPELQNEMYCQLIKQTNRRMPQNYSLTQCWQLLSLCVALFPPQQHFLWYLRQYLQHNADPTEVGKYAVYCHRSLERTLQNGEREAKPSRMEIVSILLRNPYHHSLPFSIPVHFMNNTYQQICDVISKWEQALKELHPGKNEGTRIVRLIYKNDTWLYHLTVAAGSNATLKVGTEYEQLIGKLMDVEGDPSVLWKSEALSFCKEGLRLPLTTLPSEALQTEALKLFKLITEKKTFYLTADSPNILEEWIRVLQNILKVQTSSPIAVETRAKPIVRGWLTKVKHGHSKLVWCSLVGKVFHYFRNQEDKLPLGQLQMREASVLEVDRSCDSDEDYEAGDRGFLSSHCTLVVQPKDQSPTYLLIGTKQEKLRFRAQVKGETERERLLLVYQVNDEIQQGLFPVNKELALEVAALIAQVEHGDFERPCVSLPAGSPQSKSQLILLQALERFYPKRYKQECTTEQLDLTERLASKWSMLRGCSASECVRIYLTVARKWPLFGAKLFSAKPVPPSPVDQGQVWLAVSEDGLCVLDGTMHTLFMYPYHSVITFGGCRDDFMVVTSQQRESGVGKKNVEKLVFAMAKPKILELTLLMASYINHWNPTVPSSCHQPLGQWDVDSRHFPAMNYTTKGPTLL